MYIHICIHIFTYVYVYVHVYMYLYIHIYVYTHIYIHIYIHLYTYICTTYVRIYIWIYIYINTLFLPTHTLFRAREHSLSLLPQTCAPNARMRMLFPFISHFPPGSLFLCCKYTGLSMSGHELRCWPVRAWVTRARRTGEQERERERGSVCVCVRERERRTTRERWNERWRE